MKVLWLLIALAELQIAPVVAFTPCHHGECRHQQTRLQATSSSDEQIEKFQVASSRGSKAVQQQKPKGASPWDSFKNSIYGTVDNVGTLSEKLKSGDGDSGVVEGGYATIEQTMNAKSSLSPGQRLMNEYRARSTTTTPAAPVEKSTGSAFDAFKETVYGGIDVASAVFSNDEQADSEESLRSFKPLVQSTLASSEVQGALPDLQSNNPITRKIAEGKIKNWEEKERKRQRALEREEAARKFKESVYQFGDAVVASAESLAAVPEVVAQAADETKVIAKSVQKKVDEIPSKVDNVINTVTAIPDQVKAKSDQVQDSVKTTVETTKQAIDEVQKIPTKIEKSYKDTQQTVNGVVEAVDETVTNVKVLVGLEKPVPKPPKVPPPPPPTAKELGVKLAGNVVTGTAKLAWWAGKSATAAAWNGAQSAYKKNVAEKDKVVAMEEPSNIQVDAEVQEALDLARSALEYADQGISDDDKKESDGKKGKDDEKKEPFFLKDEKK